MIDEGVEAVEYGDLHEFYTTVEGRRSTETQSQYVQIIKRLRKLLKLDDTVMLVDVDATEILKAIFSDSFHANGKMKTKSSPEKYRNSLMNYYRKRNKDIPREIEVDLAGFIQGRAGAVATARLNGELKATEGKDVLEYSTYRSIAAASMIDDYIDGHLFFLMLWNMSCRGDTTHNLHLSCIKWMNDALVIHIPKSKSHQRGAERGEEHKFSIYSNPLNPEVDIFLALGIKILTTTLVQENAPLYRSTEKDHFAKWLRQQVELHEQESSELKTKSDLGVQSLRKGALTFCLGFPGAASAISALLRAGYLLGGVMPRYVALAIEGDCNVSRILCGLPAQSEDLSLLPVRFKPNQRVNWSDFICDLDSYPAEFQACIPYLVASVVYHSDWLLKQLPSTHGLFQTRFWRAGYHTSLRDSILAPVRMFCPKTGMRATGVSPLTVVLDRIASLPTTSQAPAQSSSAAIVEAPTPALAPIVSQLNGLTTVVAQLTAAVSALTAQQVPATGAAPVVAPMQLRQAVTEAFPWPKNIPLRQIYLLWYEGLTWHGGVYPLSTIPAKNLSKDARKYVSYAKACVATIEEHLPAAFRYQSNAEQDSQFKSACRILALQLIACGHESEEKDLITKLICNDYASLYMNDFKYLRLKES